MGLGSWERKWFKDLLSRKHTEGDTPASDGFEMNTCKCKGGMADFPKSTVLQRLGEWAYM